MGHLSPSARMAGLATVAALAMALITSTAFAAPSKTQYIKAADQICTTTATQAKKLPEPPKSVRENSNPTPAEMMQVGKYVKVLSRIGLQANTHLLALASPAGDSATTTRIWQSQKKLWNLTMLFGQAYESYGILALFSFASPINKAEAAYSHLARQYGLHSCAAKKDA